jgi:hypothetical protein
MRTYEPTSWTFWIKTASHENVDNKNTQMSKISRSYKLKFKNINFVHNIQLKIIFEGFYYEPHTHAEEGETERGREREKRS